MQQEILKLRAEGKTYDQIQEMLGCSKGTISYHCGVGQKNKNLLRTRSRRSRVHPYERKIESFLSSKPSIIVNNPRHKTYKLIVLKIKTFTTDRKTRQMNKPNFTVQDVINKVGEAPKCYLTGEPIDITQPRTYQFDHIIPVSKGGPNSLDNLGICTKEANRAKHDMTPEQFIDLCKRILIHNGYTIQK